MSNVLSFSPKSPKFYYGPGEKSVGQRKEVWPCLVNLQTGQIAWFVFPTELRRAIEDLIGSVGSEKEVYSFFQLPYKKFSSDVPAEDFEDLLSEADYLSERGDEESFSLCDQLPIEKDDLVSDHFSHQEFLRQKEEAASSICDPRKECKKLMPWLSRHEREEIVQKVIRAEMNFLETLSQDVCEIRPFDELEAEDVSFGPFYNENDFTDDLSEVPPAIIAKNSQYRLLDAKSFLAQSAVIGRQADFVKAIKDDAELAFHPEKELEMKREKGLSGFACIESPEIDSMLYNR